MGRKIRVPGLYVLRLFTTQVLSMRLALIERFVTERLSGIDACEYLHHTPDPHPTLMRVVFFFGTENLHEWILISNLNCVDSIRRHCERARLPFQARIAVSQNAGIISETTTLIDATYSSSENF